MLDATGENVVELMEKQVQNSADSLLIDQGFTDN
jgi:hypothetical protein